MQILSLRSMSGAMDGLGWGATSVTALGVLGSE